MFLFKISANIYILPIWASNVINQIVNKVINASHDITIWIPFLLYLTKKRHIQTQARQDKAWQGMTRPGEARPDEARRGGAQTRRCPLVLKNTVYAGLGTDELIPVKIPYSIKYKFVMIFDQVFTKTIRYFRNLGSHSNSMVFPAVLLNIPTDPTTQRKTISVLNMIQVVC